MVSLVNLAQSLLCCNCFCEVHVCVSRWPCPWISTSVGFIYFQFRRPYFSNAPWPISACKYLVEDLVWLTYIPCGYLLNNSSVWSFHGRNTASIGSKLSNEFAICCHCFCEMQVCASCWHVQPLLHWWAQNSPSNISKRSWFDWYTYSVDIWWITAVSGVFVGETLPVYAVYFLMNSRHVGFASVRCMYVHLNGHCPKFQPLSIAYTLP